MPSSAQLASIASSLDSYRIQFTAIGNALSALRVVSDLMITQLDQDREALASQIEAANDMISRLETSVAETPAMTSLDTAAVEADAAASASQAEGAGQTSAGLHTELPTEGATEMVADAAVDSDLVAGPEHVAAPIELAAETLTVAEVVAEAATAIETPASTKAATEAPAILATETDIVAQAPNEAPNEAEAGVALAKVDDKPGDDKSGDANVVSLADRRTPRIIASPARRRAMAVVASILVTATTTIGLHELMQTELGQRMLELSTCDANMLSATRDCGLLSWLLI